MASQSPGVHRLLQAEKRATDKVEEAKKRKVKRIKQAKDEALAEIDQYRMQRDLQFRRTQSKMMGFQGDLLEEIEAQTPEKMKDLRENYHKHTESQLAQVLNMVCDVNPEIHTNYRTTN
ncbi:V-type proton ATPase subunit G 3 isoform X1 [Saccopteryx leptura]|uniref:V-type proton ATPase subunit G 3 isoform X1 n=1 Tax=Saccopteryx leptura TaxID=249018 RepID=UPI00339BC39A